MKKMFENGIGVSLDTCHSFNERILIIKKISTHIDFFNLGPKSLSNHDEGKYLVNLINENNKKVFTSLNSISIKMNLKSDTIFSHFPTSNEDMCRAKEIAGDHNLFGIVLTPDFNDFEEKREFINKVISLKEHKFNGIFCSSNALILLRECDKANSLIKIVDDVDSGLGLIINCKNCMAINDAIEQGANAIVFGNDITHPLCISLAQGSPTLATGLIAEEIQFTRKVIKEKTFI